MSLPRLALVLPLAMDGCPPRRRERQPELAAHRRLRRRRADDRLRARLADSLARLSRHQGSEVPCFLRLMLPAGSADPCMAPVCPPDAQQVPLPHRLLTEMASAPLPSTSSSERAAPLRAALQIMPSGQWHSIHSLFPTYQHALHRAADRHARNAWQTRPVDVPCGSAVTVRPLLVSSGLTVGCILRVRPRQALGVLPCRLHRQVWETTGYVD
mmetsp:Transcript_105601/g.279960  ORF Transcript_105601/g.279960 Transcript_105601/m.279960 type:complete len:213 (+) Transcript_105601:73-711(+)